MANYESNLINSQSGAVLVIIQTTNNWINFFVCLNNGKASQMHGAALKGFNQKSEHAVDPDLKQTKSSESRILIFTLII